MSARRLVAPGRPFRAEAAVPGDKSMSHRALILAAMAQGYSRVVDLGPGGDVHKTMELLGALGAEIADGNVHSPGVKAWREPRSALDAGNSATTLRLLSGAVAGRPYPVTFVGDTSLMARPMRRLVDPLGALGARVEVSLEGTPPVTVEGGRLRGSDIELTLPSAQVRSAFELAALQAEGESSVDSPVGFRDHTERWLTALGLGEWVTAGCFRVRTGDVPAADYRIPGDPSSAAFLWAAAALSTRSMIVTSGVSLNPTRTGFLEVLEQMGAEVEREVTGSVLGEPVGRVAVRGAGLVGVRVSAPLATRVLDELPLVAVVAGRAEGETQVTGASELRAKESDRISTTAALLSDLGVETQVLPDGWLIEGRGRPFPDAVTSSFGDHRIAMAAATAAAGSSGAVTVGDSDAASISWPGFYEILEEVWSSR